MTDAVMCTVVTEARAVRERRLERKLCSAVGERLPLWRMPVQMRNTFFSVGTSGTTTGTEWSLSFALFPASMLMVAALLSKRRGSGMLEKEI